MLPLLLLLPAPSAGYRDPGLDLQACLDGGQQLDRCSSRYRSDNWPC